MGIIRKYAVALGLIFISVTAKCGVLLPFPVDASTYAVCITIGPSIGTGFLMEYSNSVYLVTARHVVFNINQPGANLYDGNLTAVGHSNTSTNIYTIRVNMALLLASNEVRCASSHDIALIRLEDCNSTNKLTAYPIPGVFCTNNINTLPGDFHQKFDDVPSGEEVYVFGFPESIGLAEIPQLDFTAPLVRRGIIAGKNFKNHTIILDCSVYDGNSGGLVLGKEWDQNLNISYPLIGIVTQWVPFNDTWVNANFHYQNHNLSNSGYSIAEPFDAVVDLVWK